MKTIIALVTTTMLALSFGSVAHAAAEKQELTFFQKVVAFLNPIIILDRR